MQLFKRVLQRLSQRILNDSELNVYSFDLLKLLALTDAELTQIKRELKGVELIHVDEFWELTEIIYKILGLKTIKPHLAAFFHEAISTGFIDAYLASNEASLKVLHFDYTFHLHDCFSITSTPEVAFYGEEKTTSFKTLKKDIYLELEYAESQIKKLVSHFSIEDTNWFEALYDFDYKFNFESEIESLFRELAFSSWRLAASKTLFVVHAFLKERNGGSYTYDLDTGESLEEKQLTIEEYLKNKK